MDDFAGYGRRLGAVVPDGDLIGVYVHGSAVLGGFSRARSDVDVLVVVARPMDATAQEALGKALAGAAIPCPGTALELSVITAATAASLDDCPFEVHIGVTPAETQVMSGAGHDGDGDLVLYAEVCRRAGLTAVGRPAAEVFGRVVHERLIDAIVGELGWGLTHAPYGYAVLNACRARRFAVDGTLRSKVDGGQWYLDRHPGDPVVLAALRCHTGDTDVTPPEPTAVESFVADSIRLVGRTAR